VVGALGWWEEVEEVADGVPEPIDGALGGLARQGLELGEGLLDRIEIRGVGRQVAQLCTAGFDRRADAGHVVGREMVHHDDVAWPQLGCQHLLDPSSVRRRTIRSCKDGGQQTAKGP
jgi:hypothetical protein